MRMDAGRRHAAPMLTPTSGLPLIKSVPSLGWRTEWRKAMVDVEIGMSENQRKRKVKWGVEVFVQWQRKVDRAEPTGRIKINGPAPHFTPHQNDVQYGDNGHKREVARNIETDTSDSGKEDYIIEMEFRCPETIQEIPTSLALELFSKTGERSDVRPLRDREWARTGSNQWSPKLQSR